MSSSLPTAAALRRLALVGAAAASNPVPASAFATPLARESDSLEAFSLAERAFLRENGQQGRREGFERPRPSSTSTPARRPNDKNSLSPPLVRLSSTVRVIRSDRNFSEHPQVQPPTPAHLDAAHLALEADSKPARSSRSSSHDTSPSRRQVLSHNLSRTRARSTTSSGVLLASSSGPNPAHFPSRVDSQTRLLSLSALFRPSFSLFGNALQSETSSSSSPPPYTSARSDGTAGGGRQQSEGDKERRREPDVPKLPLDEINTLLRHPTLYDPVLRPRHPIVLCHGLYGFDVRGPTYFRLHYWGDLLKILRGKVGAEVFVTAVPGTGSVRQRAHVLDGMLREQRPLHGKDLNFLAHSMGGLDARYLISHIQPTDYHPRSLTTLSTPHRGSEFMAWCRTNIGIGTAFDKNSEAAARAAHEDTSIPLPYSLKAPILSRAQVDEAKMASELAKKASNAAKQAKKTAEQAQSALNSLGLPQSLSVAVSEYLLDLLDSPAYANLTPSFLKEVFNPQTPDKEGVKYYSVASRTDRMPIWHPLWLPKQVLDGAEAARQAKGMGAEERWRGNDGLVSVDSAKWGHFMGVIENCDHWEMRGSSGLVSAAASAKAVAEVAKSITGSSDTKGQSSDGNKDKSGGWSWQDLYSLVGANRSKPAGGSTTAAEATAKSSAPASEDAKGLDSVATWVTGLLPVLSPSPNSSSTPSSPVSPSQPSQPNGAGSIASSSTPSNAAPSLLPSSNQARMLYGAPTSSAKPEKFNLERMTLAVCRKLYQDGL